MLQHVVNTIPLEFKNVYIAIPAEQSKERSQFKDHCYFCNLPKTKGPAESAQIVLQAGPQDSYLIMDTDILNSTNDLLKLTMLNHCGVLVRRSNNPAYSYVDCLGAFKHIKEKERISEYAVQGAYFIPKTAFTEFKTQLDVVVETKEEPYMSHVFDRMTLEKYAVPTTYIPVDWGTPKDLEMSGAYIVSDKED